MTNTIYFDENRNLYHPYTMPMKKLQHIGLPLFENRWELTKETRKVSKSSENGRVVTIEPDALLFDAFRVSFVSSQGFSKSGNPDVLKLFHRHSVWMIRISLYTGFASFSGCACFILLANIPRCELNSNMCVRRWINIWSSTGNSLLIWIKNNYPV
jgi:hypothetical protein